MLGVLDLVYQVAGLCEAAEGALVGFEVLGNDSDTLGVVTCGIALSIRPAARHWRERISWSEGSWRLWPK